MVAANQWVVTAAVLIMGTGLRAHARPEQMSPPQRATLTEQKPPKRQAQPAAKTDPQKPPASGAVRINPKDGLKYVWIPPGTFKMGCSPGDIECYDWEMPAHRVIISRGFWMGQTEVTAGAYKRYARTTGRGMPPEPAFGDPLNVGWSHDRIPIVNVTWHEARAYCGWAGGRLPTEAEWEYAARGGSGEARYGSLEEVAWYADNSGRKQIDSARMIRDEWNKYLERLNENGNRIHEVAQKRANGYGLFDVLGNVAEWVNDWYDEKYYRNSPAVDPVGPSSGRLRALRGGSWDEFPRRVRASVRNSFEPRSRYVSYGFRCVGEAR